MQMSVLNAVGTFVGCPVPRLDVFEGRFRAIMAVDEPR
jgi:hypothetical protein